MNMKYMWRIVKRFKKYVIGVLGGVGREIKIEVIFKEIKMIILKDERY